MSASETLANILKQLKDLTVFNSQIGDRLSALEEGSGGKKDAKSEEAPEGSEQGQVQQIRVHTASKEKALTLTFGETDCSTNSLRLFIDHFAIAKQQNQRKGVDGWDNAEFRANELRFQLRGEPALWISQECAMLKEWTKNDDEIINRLKSRFMGTQSIELNIIAFEELAQQESETLAQYMTRCQQRGYEAFATLNEPLGMQQRIVWKFLSGIKDPEVRKAVIREKWMKTNSEAKSYEEVLKIAETAKMSKIATAATGQNPQNVQRVNVAAAKSRVQERRGTNFRSQHSSSESNKSGASYSSSSRSGSSARYSPTPNKGPATGNFNCHYCHSTSHYGGWKMCPDRSKNDPDWTPSTTKKGF